MFGSKLSKHAHPVINHGTRQRNGSNFAKEDVNLEDKMWLQTTVMRFSFVPKHIDFTGETSKLETFFLSVISL